MKREEKKTGKAYENKHVHCTTGESNEYSEIKKPDTLIKEHSGTSKPCKRSDNSNSFYCSVDENLGISNSWGHTNIESV